MSRCRCARCGLGAVHVGGLTVVCVGRWRLRGKGALGGMMSLGQVLSVDV